MLTQGPSIDPECELHLHLTLPHPLHCLNCVKDIMVTVLLFQVICGWDGWGVVHLC